MEPDPPVPTAATWHPIGPVTVRVTFSHLLIADPLLDTANWFVRVGNIEQLVTAASVAAGNVELLTIAGLANLGPDSVSFSPPPFDLVSDTVKPTPAPAFANYPLT